MVWTWFLLHVKESRWAESSSGGNDWLNEIDEEKRERRNKREKWSQTARMNQPSRPSQAGRGWLVLCMQCNRSYSNILAPHCVCVCVFMCVWECRITSSDCQLILSALSLHISESMYTYSHVYKQTLLSHNTASTCQTVWLALSLAHTYAHLSRWCLRHPLALKPPHTYYRHKIQQDA